MCYNINSGKRLNIKARQKEVNMLSEKKKPGAYSGYTQARKTANAKYEAETVERISLVVPKGHKADIKALSLIHIYSTCVSNPGPPFVKT